MGLILDSTAAVTAERRGKNARQLLETVALETGDEGIAVSAVTVLELAHGIVRAGTTERRGRRQRFLDELLTGVPIQPVTDGMLGYEKARCPPKHPQPINCSYPLN